MARAKWHWHDDTGTMVAHLNALWHTQQFFGPEWGVGVVTDFWSSDICVYFTIIHYKPVVGDSAINCAVGVFDTGAFSQARWH